MESIADKRLGNPDQIHGKPGTSAPRRASAGFRRSSTPMIVRGWLIPMAFVVATAFLFTTAFYALDVFLLEGKVAVPFGVVEHYLHFTPELITDALPALGTVLVAALGIVLTVIAIIVQLSAERYTGVAMMFLRDPVHIAVLSFYVIASLCALWLSVTLRSDFVPVGLLLLVMTLASAGLASMLPYFAYTFWFLEPGNILVRLRKHAVRLSQCGMSAANVSDAGLFQMRLVKRLEEITDIANNSIDGQDKIVAGHAVDAFLDFILEYTANKPQGAHHWYQIGQELQGNLDFVGMDEELKAELEARGLWVEWKMLHEYADVYHNALDSMADVSSLLAVDTRYLGEVAASSGQSILVRMVFRFMNLFMRTAIQAGNSHTCCDVSLQYRMLLAELLQSGLTDAACEGAAFLKDYGEIAFQEQLPVVTEAVAYDIAALCRITCKDKLAGECRLFRILLNLDSEDPTNGYKQKQSLRGVRSAQASLALFYLSLGEEAKAKMISEDMRGMSPEMREAVEQDLLSVARPDSWEVVDRGRNLHYLTESERTQISVFFRWLDGSEV